VADLRHVSISTTWNCAALSVPFGDRIQAREKEHLFRKEEEEEEMKQC
jgi:hypothetical protein